MILFVITLTLWPLGLTGNVSDSSSPVDYVDKSKSDVICAKKTCVNRCCSQGEYLKCDFDVNSIFCHCEPSNSSVDKHDQMFANVQLYSNKFYGEKVDTKFAKAFVLVPSFYPNASDEFKTTASPVIDLEPHSRAYLGMDGKIQMESPNAYKRWTVYDTDKFCVDIVVVVGDEKVDYVVNMTPLVPVNKAYVYPMFVSSFFLMLLLVVYAVLPDLRNLPGKILMAYVISQIIAFISLAIMQLFKGLPENSCIILTSITYDSFLSSFCWMNVMSYDIFWTFRSYAKARVHRTGENFKFAMYCLYAWGVPLALTAMMLMMHNADFSDKPWVTQPLLIEMGCFLIEGQIFVYLYVPMLILIICNWVFFLLTVFNIWRFGQKFVYLYVPMLILIICNWVFFLLTVFNIWRVSRATAVVRSPASGNAAAHRAHKLRFVLYIKLSVIMGVNWLLEVVSSFYPELSGWWVTDLYNLLVGFFIFIIFIFRSKIYKDLQAKFSSIRLDQWSTTNSANNSTSESNLSQDQRVSKHPRHFGGLRSR